MDGCRILLYAFYADPVLVEDMMDTMLDLTLAVTDKAPPDLMVDQANFWEDMCYKTGPLISPDMFKKYMVPRYRKVTDLLTNLPLFTALPRDELCKAHMRRFDVQLP